jgi:type III restriction enzyme
VKRTNWSPAKLGRFTYNPDWAIAFKEGNIKHLYFVAETKSTMVDIKLRVEEQKRSSAPRSSLMQLVAPSMRGRLDTAK